MVIIESFVNPLDLGIYCPIIRGMARPPKDPDSLQTTAVRIMVTAEQKALFDRAARASGLGNTSAWARAILAKAASEELDDIRNSARRADLRDKP